MNNMENKERALSEVIKNGGCSYGDVQMYMEVNKLDELELTNGTVVRDNIGKLCVKIYDEHEGTCDLMGLDMFLAIRKNEQIDEETDNVSKLHKVFNLKNLLKLLWIVGLIVVLINLGSIDAVSFILGELFGIVFVVIDKMSDKDKQNNHDNYRY